MSQLLKLLTLSAVLLMVLSQAHGAASPEPDHAVGTVKIDLLQVPAIRLLLGVLLQYQWGLHLTSPLR